jgi:hypothetical protein
MLRLLTPDGIVGSVIPAGLMNPHGKPSTTVFQDDLCGHILLQLSAMGKPMTLKNVR